MHLTKTSGDADAVTDRAAAVVGTVVYPVAFVAAFPLYFLAGGGGAVPR